MTLRRKKDKKSQALDLLETYLKLQAAKEATKGARKAAKGTAVYKVAKRKPILRFVPLVAGAGVAAAVVAVKKLRGGDEDARPAAA
jgi:hypothetical protein